MTWNGTTAWAEQPPIAEPAPHPQAGIAPPQQRVRRPSPAGIMWSRVTQRPGGRRWIFAGVACAIAILGARWAIDTAVNRATTDRETSLLDLVAGEIDARETTLRSDLGAEITRQVEEARSGIAPTVIGQDPLGQLPCPLSSNAQVFIGLDETGQPNVQRARAIRQQVDPLMAGGVPITSIGIGAPPDNPAGIRVVDVRADPQFGSVLLVACPTPGS